LRASGQTEAGGEGRGIPESRRWTVMILKKDKYGLLHLIRYREGAGDPISGKGEKAKTPLS